MSEIHPGSPRLRAHPRRRHLLGRHHRFGGAPGSCHPPSACGPAADRGSLSSGPAGCRTACWGCSRLFTAPTGDRRGRPGGLGSTESLTDPAKCAPGSVKGSLWQSPRGRDAAPVTDGVRGAPKGLSSHRPTLFAWQRAFRSPAPILRRFSYLFLFLAPQEGIEK